MKGPKQQPYDITAAKLKNYESFDELARYLCEEIDNARAVRDHVERDLDYWHRIYEQDRTRIESNRPKPNGADLTSYIGTQYVDALHARVMKTIYTGKPWVVEGWGESAKKAPFVEEFHAWAAEDERLQTYLDQTVQNALIDSVGILEVSEGTDYRPIRKTIWAQIETQPDELGQPRAVFDEQHRPKLLMQPDGKYVEVPAPQEGQPIPAGIAQVEIDSYECERVGPVYDVVDYVNFYTLPSHAQSRRDVWGYAKRFFRRYPYLQQKAKDGIYDAKAIEAIGDDNEREDTADDLRRGVTVARQDGRTAEKELYEVPLLIDLDGTGERWWVATVSHKNTQLLRLKHDDLASEAGVGRFVRFVPYPRKNSVDGLSVVGHKLITIIEEHTAVRNIKADRAALSASAPIKVQQGALYDPEEQPFGAGSVIYVRDMKEVEVMTIPDIGSGMMHWAGECLDAAERTMGITDVASGVEPDEKRTATERRLTAGYSEIRTDLVIKRMQEPMEDLFQIRHAIWKRVLAAKREGLALPSGAMSGLEARGVEISTMREGKVTADLLEGKFRGKPRGSVETADPSMRRQNLNGMLQSLAPIMQINQMVGAMLGTPAAARALLDAVLTAYNIEDKQAFLGSPAQEAMSTAGMLQDPRISQLLQSMGGGGQPPGMGGQPQMGGAPPPAQMPMGIQ